MSQHIICSACGGYTPNPSQRTETYFKDRFDKYTRWKLMNAVTKYRSTRLVTAILLGWVKHCDKCGEEFAEIYVPLSPATMKLLSFLQENINCFKRPDRGLRNQNGLKIPDWVSLHGYKGQPPYASGFVADQSANK